MAALAIKADGRYLDATFGRGGHARAILAALGPRGRLLALDRDPQAIAAGEPLRAGSGGRFGLRHTAFSRLLEAWHEYAGEAQADGVLFDLGVSSPQLDQAERGFGFMHDGPLDMRMDPGSGEPASAWLNRASEREIADVLHEYGEERQARRIAAAIVRRRAERPLERTGELADLIASVIGRREPGRHPATRSFQAIRILVNDELGELRRGLEQALAVLRPGGRLAVISFHSLEDRIVKHFFKQEASDCICPPEQPVCTCNHRASITIVTKKPVIASPDEQARNPRARSAKLRVAQKKG